MSRLSVKILIIFCIAMVAVSAVLEDSAHARVGGSRSMGSKGSRSYSRPASPAPAYQPPPSRPVQPMPAPQYQPPRPASGGFFRSMAGGIVGGMLGGMLFRSLGFGGMGMGGMGGGGIGLFDILLLAGIGYLIYRFVTRKRDEEKYTATTYAEPAYSTPTYSQDYQQPAPGGADLTTGLAHIRQFDPAFDEARYCDLVMDNFFKIQGAWMNRELSAVGPLLTDEIQRIFQSDLDALLCNRQINRLENIAVRNVEIVEAWQESGRDFITTLIYANLLDYTTDEAGTLISGSKSDPVKFEEYWTFTRQVGTGQWQLSAIDQK